MKTWKIVGCDFFPFSYPFKGIFPPPIGERRGFFLRLEAEAPDGIKKVGWGECAPLEGFGLRADTFEVAWELRQMLKASLEGLAIQLQPRPPFFAPLELSFPLPPSLNFALEMALYDLNPSPNIFPVSVNALLFPQNERDIPRLAEELLGKNFSSVKVKIGRSELDKELDFLNQLSRATRGKISFRLDANCSFKWEEFLELERRLLDLPIDIDYVEEPFADLNCWDRCLDFGPGNPRPGLAVDENLYPLMKNGVIEKLTEVKAIILKPSLLGGLHETLRLMNWAREHNRTFVLSSAYNCGRTLLALASFSQILGENSTPQGLGTSSYLQEDSSFSSYLLQHGGLLPLGPQ